MGDEDLCWNNNTFGGGKRERKGRGAACIAINVPLGS